MLTTTNSLAIYAEVVAHSLLFIQQGKGDFQQMQ
mgnify:CR=1 FL=1